MEMQIVVLESDEKRRHDLCTILEERQYQAIPMDSYQNLISHIQANPCRIVILDLDTDEIDRNSIFKIKDISPSVCILGLSSRLYHPELKEQMIRHIYACLKRPVDEEELIFLIKSLN